MSQTGEPDAAHQKIGIAFADIFSGLYGVIGIQAALAEREKSGLGQQIDIALFDCMTGVLANQAMNYLATGQAPRRLGNAHPNIVPYQTFPTSDGHIIIAGGNDRQFQSLCDVLGALQIAGDQRFQQNPDRVANRKALTALLTNLLFGWTKAEILEALEAAEVPAGPINDVKEALTDPQIVHRGMLISPKGVSGIRTPITFSRSRLILDKASPAKPDT